MRPRRHDDVQEDPMAARPLFTEDHQRFRDSVRRFLAAEVVPHHERWEDQGFVDREVWIRAGSQGMLCSSMPEAYGGAGADRLYSVVLMEEIARINATGLGFGLHSEIVAPYLLRYGTEAQKQRWLPRMATGESIGAIAMSEPAAGSDLQGIRTAAVRSSRDGQAGWRLSGSKTFITNGWHADLVVVVARTDPAKGAKGISLFVVEAGTPGFSKGKRLKKLGLKAQDTSELFFEDVFLPDDSLLGREGEGFAYLMQELPWERLQIAISAIESAQAAIDQTVAYVRDRKVFGQPVAHYQHTRFTLAELQTETRIGRVFVDHCLGLLQAGELDTATASMAKYWCTDLQCKVIDGCLQLHGGYGFMWEYPIARAYADARVQRIYGGTNEIMKELITRSMGLGAPKG
jgi:alkylation response protein AidB-like acyl-CoA dehydrogenase